MQHHDAITGTHMHATGQDYLRMMSEGQGSTLAALGSQVEHLASLQGLNLTETVKFNLEETTITLNEA